MLKIENFVTPSPDQWMFVIDGMRNPKNSWDRMDSYTTHIGDNETLETAEYAFFLGENDEDLAMRLAKGGPVHAKYRRQLPVHVKVTAPLYWWKEFETYRNGVCPNPTDIETNSCSTMHTIEKREFTLEDFSCEHLRPFALETLRKDIIKLNYYRNTYLYGGDDFGVDGKYITFEPKDKDIWWQLIQLLPSSYNQTRSLSMNYEVLANMYEWRRTHKLDEWHTFCNWIEELPYSTLITGDLSEA